MFTYLIPVKTKLARVDLFAHVLREFVADHPLTLTLKYTPVDPVCVWHGPVCRPFACVVVLFVVHVSGWSAYNEADPGWVASIDILYIFWTVDGHSIKLLRLQEYDRHEISFNLAASHCIFW